MDPQQVVNILAKMSDIRYIAMDENKLWYAFYSEIIRGQHMWYCDESDHALCLSDFDFKLPTDIDWKESLFVAEEVEEPYYTNAIRWWINLSDDLKLHALSTFVGLTVEPSNAEIELMYIRLNKTII